MKIVMNYPTDCNAVAAATQTSFLSQKAATAPLPPAIAEATESIASSRVPQVSSGFT